MTSDYIPPIEPSERRNELTQRIANLLRDFLQQHGWSVLTVTHSSEGEPETTPPFSTLKAHEVCIEFRAKSDESIRNKMALLKCSLNEILDLYAFRIVTFDILESDTLATLIRNSFGKTPTNEEMSICGGTITLPSIRDYRRRDWKGLSPATSKRYDEAIHINRKIDETMIEIQLMTQHLYQRFCDASQEESHAAYKQRLELKPR